MLEVFDASRCHGEHPTFNIEPSRIQNREFPGSNQHWSTLNVEHPTIAEAVPEEWVNPSDSTSASIREVFGGWGKPED